MCAHSLLHLHRPLALFSLQPSTNKLAFHSTNFSFSLPELLPSGRDHLHTATPRAVCISLPSLPRPAQYKTAEDSVLSLGAPPLFSRPPPSSLHHSTTTYPCAWVYFLSNHLIFRGLEPDIFLYIIEGIVIGNHISFSLELMRIRL